MNIFKSQIFFILPLLTFFILTTIRCDKYSDSLKVGIFRINVTPQIGSPVESRSFFHESDL
jgi:hypothetical protein